MEKFTTDAITLRSYNLSESDKIIVMYSKDKGLLRCVAKGAKKPSPKIGSCFDSLIASQVLIAKGKKLDTIDQSQGINSFSGLRKDFDKLSYAMYCADIINAFSIEGDLGSEEIYELFYNTLNAIAKSKNKLNTILCVTKFQMNLMEILGYGLELNNCVKCLCPIGESAVFSKEAGGVICPDCTADYNNQISSKLVNFFKKIAGADFENKYFVDEPIKNELTIMYCFNLMKDYIQIRSPKKLKAQELLGIV
ncbi:MAG: DNA repair protein RecO [Candidatus Gastranaerophilales bacterium]|nr:DNA repair protein RecO [Candidatus Gastranaerophilales bacterium]